MPISATLLHTAVAILISQRVHPEAIKRFLGHSSIMVTMDIYGHPFPSDQEALANALDDAFAQSQTDKRRTETDKNPSTEESDRRKGQATLDFSEVGPEGIEPSTFGLKVRRTPFPSVSSCRVVRGNSRDTEPAEPRFVSSRAVLFPCRRLQIGLHLRTGDPWGRSFYLCLFQVPRNAGQEARAIDDLGRRDFMARSIWNRGWHAVQQGPAFWRAGHRRFRCRARQVGKLPISASHMRREYRTQNLSRK